MKKRFFQKVVAIALAAVVLTTGIAIPPKVEAYSSGTNYEKNYSYEYDSMMVGTNQTMYLNADSDNDYNHNYDYSYKHGFCAYGEDSSQDSDYIKTTIDRSVALAAYKELMASVGKTVGDEYDTDVTKIVPEFTYKGVHYDCDYVTPAGATESVCSYFTISGNPNISYAVTSSNPAIVSATPYIPADNGGTSYQTIMDYAKLYAVAPSNGAYVTITITRRNNRTGSTQTSVRYVKTETTQVETNTIRTCIIGKEDEDSYNGISLSNEFSCGSSTNYTINGVSDMFNYSFSDSTYNPTTKKSDTTYTAVKYALVSSNPAIVEPADTTGLSYHVKAVGTAILTVKQVVQTLTKTYPSADADPVYTLGAASESVLGNVTVKVVSDDTTASYYIINHEMAIGDSYQIYLGHSYSAQAKFSYSLTKKAKKIVSVDSNGVVKAKKKGTAKVTVKLNYNDGRSVSKNKKVATITIKVRKANVNVGKRSQIVTIGDNTYCVPISYKNDNYKYSYKTSNKKIAVVSKMGLVTGKKAGTTTISVYEKKSKKKKAKAKKIGSYTIYVRKATTDGVYFITKLYNRESGVNSTVAQMSVAKGVKFNVAKYLYGDTSSISDLKISYKSSKKSVAAVAKNGVVSAKKTGKTVITVKSGANKRKLTLNVVNGDKSSKAKAKQLNAALKISKLSGVVTTTSKNEIKTFKKASALYKKYLAAYNAYYDVTVKNKTDKNKAGSVGGTDPDVSKNNYIAVPNEELLWKASAALSNYFGYTKADYSVDATYKVSKFAGKTGTVTFKDKLTKNDILKYCFDQGLPYSASTAVRYSASFSSSNYQYVSTPLASTGRHVELDPATNTYVAKEEEYPVNAAGQYVERKYQQTFTITYTNYNGEVLGTATGVYDATKKENPNKIVDATTGKNLGEVYNDSCWIDRKDITSADGYSYYCSGKITAITASTPIETVNMEYVNVGGSSNVSGIVTRKKGTKTGKIILGSTVRIYNAYGKDVKDVNDEGYKKNATIYAISPTKIKGKMTIGGLTVKNVSYSK